MFLTCWRLLHERSGRAGWWYIEASFFEKKKRKISNWKTDLLEKSLRWHGFDEETCQTTHYHVFPALCFHVSAFTALVTKDAIARCRSAQLLPCNASRHAPLLILQLLLKIARDLRDKRRIIGMLSSFVLFWTAFSLSTCSIGMNEDCILYPLWIGSFEKCRLHAMPH